MQTNDWHGLYGESWSGIIVPEAFAHPAKFSRGLIRHIYQHLLDEGWLAPGDTVLDPFGGVALGAWPALQMGLHWIGVELEQPFCDLGQGCDCTGIDKADWMRFYDRWDKARYLDGRHWCPECLANAKVVIERNGQLSMFDAPPTTSYIRNSGQIPRTEPHRYRGNIERWAAITRNGASAVLLQGDSRRLAEVVGEAGGLVGSPPYCDSSICQQADGDIGGQFKDGKRGTNAANGKERQYSANPANLGNMAAGEPPGVDGVIGSPPWADAGVGGTKNVVNLNTQCVSKNRPDNVGPGQEAGNLRYGEHTEGQLAAMPPGPCPSRTGLGQAADGLVGSPPYSTANSTGGGIGKAIKAGGNYKTARPLYRYGRSLGYMEIDHGFSPGQLGQESGTTFWSAARLILQQCYQVLKPGAPAVWVVKRFVRNKQIIEFSQQWADLCQACGFELVHWHKAWLVEDGGTQLGLLGDDKRNVKKRYSFFRRLHSQKYPALEIQWEDVLCTVKR